MRKRLVALVAIALVGLGIWLSNLFNGFGLGGGGAGPGTGENASTESAEARDTLVSLPRSTQPAAEATSAADSAAGDSGKVLTVLVSKDRYQLQSGPDASASFQPATLADIVKQASSATGDENGLRVRLRYKDNAQMGATTDLYEALQTAGIRREEIMEDPDAVN